MIIRNELTEHVGPGVEVLKEIVDDEIFFDLTPTIDDYFLTNSNCGEIKPPITRIKGEK